MNEKTSQETNDLLVKIQAHIIQMRGLDVNDTDKQYAKNASGYIHKMYQQREEAQTKRFLEILDGLKMKRIKPTKHDNCSLDDDTWCYGHHEIVDEGDEPNGAWAKNPIITKVNKNIEQAKQKVLEER